MCRPATGTRPRPQAGDAGAVIDYEFNREHPPLVKLAYGLGILTLGDKANWAGALYVARLISAVFGVLAVLILALVDPLAGALFAVHTLTLKYTSQAYLEALPLFAGLAAVLALTRWRGGRDGGSGSRPLHWAPPRPASSPISRSSSPLFTCRSASGPAGPMS